MSLKRASTEMTQAKWEALSQIAADCDCFYSGKPSWRRLLSRIASGELVVHKAAATVLARIHRARWAARRKPPEVYAAQAERARLYQEKRRRAAGIPPRGAQEALDVATGYRDESGTLTGPG